MGLLLALLLFSFQSCELEEDVVGSIRILSVTPNSELTVGMPTDFTIKVEYELYNASQGELNVGFNTISKDVAHLVSSETVVINEGSGQHTFNPTDIAPKNWAPDGHFVAYVNISEYPHGSSWTPLDIDLLILSF